MCVYQRLIIVDPFLGCSSPFEKMVLESFNQEREKEIKIFPKLTKKIPSWSFSRSRITL